MFNERDWRCAAGQHMLSTDPSYENRTIDSTLKIQIWVVNNNRDVPRVMKTKFLAMVMAFGVVSSEGHILFEVGLKVNTKVYLDVLNNMVIPWRNQVAGGRPLVWQQDSAPAHESKETQSCHQKECYDLYLSLTGPPFPPTWTRWTNSFGHTSRTSPTWPPTTSNPAWSPPSSEWFTELQPALVEKACSQFRIRIEAMIEAEGGYIE